MAWIFWPRPLPFGFFGIPLGRVGWAVGSYVVHASYIAVCATARARETTVGPGTVARIASSAALFHCTTTLSVPGEAAANGAARTSAAPPTVAAARPTPPR